MNSKTPLIVFWFRRDLRVSDNAGLYYALRQKIPVMPLFIFDETILSKLKDKSDTRVHFIHQSLKDLNSDLKKWRSGIEVKHGKPEEIWAELIQEHDIRSVYTNHDYEPYAQKRDQSIERLLNEKGIPFKTFKDQVIFEKDEILTQNGEPYKVYTPYKNKWRETLNDFMLKSYPVELYTKHLMEFKAEIPSLKSIGFKESDVDFPVKTVSDDTIKSYASTRDCPALQEGTSHLGIHLRFGTVSVRALARHVQSLSETFLNELIWREFFMMILWHFPRTLEKPFHEKYEGVEWRNNEQEFEKWCEGKTGFTLVDAGMRQLNQTGSMHNRVRMVVASFLCKDLLIHWSWGERYFASKLLDFELSSNVGNWQWAAGTGVDAAPYFRVFNPESQQKKFDPDFKYIRRWIPEYGTPDYPQPMVDHKAARVRAIETYKRALK